MLIVPVSMKWPASLAFQMALLLFEGIHDFVKEVMPLFEAQKARACFDLCLCVGQRRERAMASSKGEG